MAVSDDAQRQICDGTWRKIRLLLVLMLTAPVLYVVVSLVFIGRRSSLDDVLPDARVRDIVFYAFAAAGVGCFLLATGLRRHMLSMAYVQRHLRSMSAAAQHYVQMTALTFSLCETSAVLGLVYFLLTGEVQRMMFLAGMGVVFPVVLWPSRSGLASAVRMTANGEDMESC